MLLGLVSSKRTHLAAEIDVHYIELSRVLNGHNDNPALRQKIADRFGLAVSDIWPEPAEKEEAA